jgi:uncharacterized protein (TIGR03118 family)
MHRFVLAAFAAAIATALLIVGAAPAASPGNHFKVTPLASDVPGLAPVTDSNLQNTWGLARSATSPWWIANNATASTSVYTGSGARINVGGLPAQGVPGEPTGTVFSGMPGSFKVGTTASPTTLEKSNFIFDGEDGTISAWRGGSTAALVTVDMSSSGAVFKGLAISNGPSGPRLYATDFAKGAGHSRVDVFDGSWNPVNTPGAFVDPRLPREYGPFGIQTIGDRVFVTYGKQQRESDDEADGRGLGIVDVYNLDGKFLRRVAEHGPLNAPWGLAWAPASFGSFGGDLLVGNFGDGHINAYEETRNGQFVLRGTLQAAKGGDLSIDGLWALEFGNTGNNGSDGTLFFTAGINDEADGLFGTVTPTH